MRTLRAFALLCPLLTLGCGAAPEMAPPDMAMTDMATLPPFPSTFLWGSATAATQVEGNVNNDWTVWAAQGHIANHQMIGTGDDDYDLFDQDNALAQSMGHNAYRFSIEWSRIEPTRGSYDMTQIQHYQAVVASCLAHGLTPVVTLEHDSLPRWADDPSTTTSLGGWTNPAVADAFVAFVKEVVPFFVDSVDLWITINEPMVQIEYGYFEGNYPPGEIANFPDALTAMTNMLSAHARAYDAIHAAYQAAGKPVQVTIAHNWTLVDPATPGVDDAAAADLDHVLNQVFVDAITTGDFDSDLLGTIQHHPEWANRLDLLGINYYQRLYIKSGMPVGPIAGQPYVDPNAMPKSDNGWELYPEGMHRALTAAWSRYHLPIVVTENGIADAADRYRPWFIVSHVQAMQQAALEGVDVRGYLHWSLVDNFEWTDGYMTKFGLAAVDVPSGNLTRVPRPSAAVYTKIIQAGGVPWDLAQMYATPPM